MEQANKQLNNQQLIAPIEGKRGKTTVNLKQIHIDAINRQIAATGTTQTAIIDDALSMVLSKFNGTALIDGMIAETNDFLFNRNLNRVVEMLPVEIAARFTPAQLAHLYVCLKDSIDRQRVFFVLSQSSALQEIDEINGCLEIASKFEGGKLLGYDLLALANQLSEVITELQKEYLIKKIGQTAFDALKELAQTAEIATIPAKPKEAI